MALKIANIHLLNPKRKIESGFGLCDNDLFNDLLLGIFWTAILFSLNIDEKPQAVA